MKAFRLVQLVQNKKELVNYAVCSDLRAHLLDSGLRRREASSSHFYWRSRSFSPSPRDATSVFFSFCFCFYRAARDARGGPGGRAAPAATATPAAPAAPAMDPFMTSPEQREGYRQYFVQTVCPSTPLHCSRMLIVMDTSVSLKSSPSWAPLVFLRRYVALSLSIF